jgi:2-methylcitrate dehydratase
MAPSATVTERLADWVLNFDTDAIPDSARARLKSSLLDAVGCAYLARESAAVRPVLSLAAELDGSGSLSVIGGGERLSLLDAVLVNGNLIRALDFNDHQAIDPNDGARLGGHPSDILAVALAVGELRGSTGDAILNAAFIGYEIFARARKALGREHSWDHVTVHGLTAPAVAGLLMGLGPDALADALSLGMAHAVTPGVVRRGRLSSAKFLASPAVMQAGTRAAQLAAHGATGPRTVFEDSDTGLNCQVFPADRLSVLTAPMGRQPMIDGVTIKAWPGLDTSQAPIAAVIGARKAFGGAIDDVAGLELVLAENPVIRRQVDDPLLARPTNRETADHSFTYLAAMALLEGEVSEAQYARAPWAEDTVRQVMAKVQLATDPALQARVPDGYPAMARIQTNSGERFECEVDYAPGHARNPMTADEITAKFHRATAGVMERTRADSIAETVMRFDKLETVQPLMQLCAG